MPSSSSASILVARVSRRKFTGSLFATGLSSERPNVGLPNPSANQDGVPLFLLYLLLAC